MCTLMSELPVLGYTSSLLALSLANVESLYYTKAAEDAFIKMLIWKAKK